MPIYNPYDFTSEFAGKVSKTGDTMSGNLVAPNIIPGLTKTTASGGTLTLTSTSNYFQTITGSSGHTVQLPDVSTLSVGHSFRIRYIGTGATNSVPIYSSGNNLVASITHSGFAQITFNGTSGTGSTSWDVLLGVSGSVSGNSVVSRNISGDTTLRILALTAGIQCGVNSETLTGNKTLGASSPQYQMLDTNGVNRDLTLPAGVTGMGFVVKNIGSTGGVITVKDSGGVPISGAIIPNTVCLVFLYTGTGWQLI